MSKVYYLLWIYFVLLVEGRPDIIEEEILEEVLYSYNKVARPATPEDPIVTVTHGINLIQVEECDGKKLKAMTWITMAWLDPRLEWSLDFYDLDSITLPSDMIWTPDVVLYNSPSSHPGNAYNPRVYVYNTGEVSWFPPTRIETNCEESEYDFDTVYCYMRFGSWSYHGKRLDVVLDRGYVDAGEDYIESPDWIFVNSTAERIVQKYTCCPEPYPYLFYNITLQRRHPERPENVNVTVSGLPEPLSGVVHEQNGNQTNSGASTKIKTNGLKALRPRKKTVQKKDKKGDKIVDDDDWRK